MGPDKRAGLMKNAGPLRSTFENYSENMEGKTSTVKYVNI